MDEEAIIRMRDRISRARRVIELAHNPEIIALLEELIEEAEADICRMETDARPAIPLKPK
jgi:hypothetical protein